MSSTRRSRRGPSMTPFAPRGPQTTLFGGTSASRETMLGPLPAPFRPSETQASEIGPRIPNVCTQLHLLNRTAVSRGSRLSSPPARPSALWRNVSASTMRRARPSPPTGPMDPMTAP